MQLWTWLQQGRLKALALGAPTRHPMLPELPTLSELWHPAANRWSAFGLFAPGTMSPALRQRLHALLAEALDDGWGKPSCAASTASSPRGVVSVLLHGWQSRRAALGSS